MALVVVCARDRPHKLTNAATSYYKRTTTRRGAALYLRMENQEDSSSSPVLFERKVEKADKTCLPVVEVTHSNAVKMRAHHPS
jgi:hypothetical protein